MRATLLACVFIGSGVWACDSASGPAEATVDEPMIDATLLNPPAPILVTEVEQAALAAPLQADTAPWIGGLVASNSFAQASATTCTIGFADYVGLLILPQKAGHTFASSPYYIQGCGSGWVHVKENDVARYGASWGSGYNHYHLMYEKGPYCIPAGGSYGYSSGGSCVNVPDPATEPRYLASHHGSQWVRIYVYKSGVAEMTFDFKSIKVKGPQGIKLYFRKANGSWLHWNNLGTGTWNVAPYAAGIKEILIRASGNSASSYSFDNIKVGVN
jgi:hypothetical protein